MDNSAINIAVSNSLKDVVDGKVVVNGELQNMAEGWVVVNGVWKRVWPPTVAPVSASPSDISGMTAWCSASDITGLSDNDDVSTWSDLSGNNKHFTQATADYCPHYKTDIVNGKPALLFDGSDDKMACASLTNVKTIVVVAKYIQATFNNYDGLITAPTGNIWLVGTAGADDWYKDETPNHTFYKDGNASSIDVTNAWHIFIVTTSSAQNIYVQMGQDRNNAGRFWDGYVAEYISYSGVVSGADFTNLVAYLKNKYGIA